MRRALVILASSLVAVAFGTMAAQASDSRANCGAANSIRAPGRFALAAGSFKPGRRQETIQVVQFNDVPEPVKQTAAKQFPMARFTRAEKHTTGRKSYFVLEGNEASKTVTLKVDPSGKVVSSSKSNRARTSSLKN